MTALHMTVVGTTAKLIDGAFLAGLNHVPNRGTGVYREGIDHHRVVNSTTDTSHR